MFPCVYRNRSQMTSQQRVKNKKYETKFEWPVAWLVLYTLLRLLCDLLQDTRTEKYNLLISYNKNSNGLLKDFLGMRKEKTSPLTWIWRHLCVWANENAHRSHGAFCVPLSVSTSFHLWNWGDVILSTNFINKCRILTLTLILILTLILTQKRRKSEG